MKGESERKRRNRELIELLNELRVVPPGVQVLFAFLLIVPFNQRFSDLTLLQRQVYFFALVMAALASALLIAPSAYHRMQFRRGDKERLLLTSNRLILGGMGCLAVAIVASLFLITGMVFGTRAATITAVPAAVLFLVLWYLEPLRRREAAPMEEPPVRRLPAVRPVVTGRAAGVPAGQDPARSAVERGRARQVAPEEEVPGLANTD